MYHKLRLEKKCTEIVNLCDIQLFWVKILERDLDVLTWNVDIKFSVFISQRKNVYYTFSRRSLEHFKWIMKMMVS